MDTTALGGKFSSTCSVTKISEKDLTPPTRGRQQWNGRRSNDCQVALDVLSSMVKSKVVWYMLLELWLGRENGRTVAIDQRTPKTEKQENPCHGGDHKENPSRTPSCQPSETMPK